MQEEATHKGLDFRGGVRTGDADLSYCVSRWWRSHGLGELPQKQVLEKKERRGGDGRLVS